MIKISLLTAGGEKHYQLGLISGLLPTGIKIDVIGNDKMEGDAMFDSPNITFYNLRGDQAQNISIIKKISRILKYYYKLIVYSIRTDSKIFHIQWLNKFIYFDKIILNSFYKILGKKLIFTVHDVDHKKVLLGQKHLREKWSFTGWTRSTASSIMYSLMDYIIVHNNKVKEEIVRDFGVSPNKISVIPHGINYKGIQSKITRVDARKKLTIDANKKVILFFGNIAYSKGLELLLDSFEQLVIQNPDYLLVIAGQPRIGHEKYMKEITSLISSPAINKNVLTNFTFIDENDIEKYFMAADCLVLPYRFVYQSGVTYLAYSFGTPVIATNVGNFSEEIIDGKTGFICNENNVSGLTSAIKKYFSSNLYLNLDQSRHQIKQYTEEKYSWEKIGRMHFNIYELVNKSN